MINCRDTGPLGGSHPNISEAISYDLVSLDEDDALSTDASSYKD